MGIEKQAVGNGIQIPDCDPYRYAVYMGDRSFKTSNGEIISFKNNVSRP